LPFFCWCILCVVVWSCCSVFWCNTFFSIRLDVLRGWCGTVSGCVWVWHYGVTLLKLWYWVIVLLSLRGDWFYWWREMFLFYSDVLLCVWCAVYPSRVCVCLCVVCIVSIVCVYYIYRARVCVWFTRTLYRSCVCGVHYIVCVCVCVCVCVWCALYLSCLCVCVCGVHCIYRVFVCGVQYIHVCVCVCVCVCVVCSISIVCVWCVQYIFSSIFRFESGITWGCPTQVETCRSFMYLFKAQ
jgi:hypothetical protein